MNLLNEIVLDLINNIENKEDIKNKSITDLVENLIRSEVKPGGPYKVEDEVDPILNAHIFKLFILLKKPLPNVEEYLNNYVQLSARPLDYGLEVLLSEINHLSNSSDQSIQDTVHKYEFYESFLKSLTVEVRQYSKVIGNKVINVDKDGEISNISRIFQNSLISPPDFKTDDLELIGQANFMIWVAYSIYDSVIDNDLEQGSLSAANIFLREAIRLYLLVKVDINLIVKYTNKVDNANAWETSHCRFKVDQHKVVLNLIPSIDSMEKLLSNRAIAHIIGPMFIASKSKLNTHQLKIIEQALTYYCIARQINDDLHDWVDDFNGGRITFVVASLLRSLEAKDGIKNKKILLKKMKALFYESELEHLCKLTESYITKSIQLLTENGLKNSENSFIDSILKPIQTSAIKARQVHQSNKLTVSDLDI